MKVLLLNVPIAFNEWQNLEMPLGIAYIASVLEKNGHEVFVKDYEVEKLNENEMKKEFNNIDPHIVGISFRSSSYGSAKIISSILKEINRNIPIVLGGHHATAFPEETLNDIESDFIIRGEAESTIVRLVEGLEGKRRLESIKGIVYKSNRDVIQNGTSDDIEELDLLPFPAWHLFPMERYVVAPILTSRGCPFACIYCDKGVSNRKVRFRSPENIYEEIVEVERRHKKGKIYFVDDYFSLNKERLLKIFKLISKDKTLNLEWSCQARVDGVDRDILKLAKKTGCNMIIYGIETGDEEELKYINKKTTLEQTEKAVLLTKESGIKTRANFMIGFPNSTHKTIKNSLKFAKKLNADIYRFFIVSPLPNTVLWDRVLKKNPELSKIGWDKFDFYSPCYDTLELKKEEISDYVGAAYLYMLKGLLIKEFTIGLLPNVFKLGRLIIKTKRLRGNISKSFPVFVNLFLELWFIVKGMGLKERLVYLKKIFILERKIRKDK